MDQAIEINAAPLIRAAGVTEFSVGDELLLWGRAALVPVHLNHSGAAVWRATADVCTAGQVIDRVAAVYGETPDRVGAPVQSALTALASAELLGMGDHPVASAVERERPVAVVGERAGMWLARRQAHVQLIDVTRQTHSGSVIGVASNSLEVHALVGRSFADWCIGVGGPDGPAEARVRFHLIDAGQGEGSRYWLLSSSGLPLDHVSSPEALIDCLDLHLGEAADVMAGTGPALRMAVLEAADHCIAVQWDLLASRPVVERRLTDAGYRIRSGQWARLGADPPTVLPCRALRAGAATGRPCDDAHGALPIDAVVVWFGAGSLDAAHTLGEWVWTLVALASTNPDVVITDRLPLLDSLVALAQQVPLVGLTDPGPSALLEMLVEPS